MIDYKILQNIDLAQNEIKEVSKISNDRVGDGSKKHIVIQTGDDTTLTLASKETSKEKSAFNFIESNTKGEAESDKASLSSNIKSTPEGIDIVHKRTDKSKNSEESKISAYTDESDKRGHILVQSPLVDIQTGGTLYEDPSIELSKKNGSTLGDMSLKSNKIALSGGTTSLNSNISIEEGSINAESENVKLSSEDTTSAVLTLDQETQTISSSAVKEIKETVDKVSISLLKETKGNTSSQSITLSNTVESSVESSKSPSSKIEVNESNIKISKGENTSFTEVTSTTLNGVSSNISLATSENNPDVSLILNKTDSSAKLTSSGKITLTSKNEVNDEVNEATTEYDYNSITSTADNILFKTKGYKTDDTDASSINPSYPHIELSSNKSEKSIVVEGKNIFISSADESTSTDKTDSVDITGTALNIGSTTTNITSNTINIQNLSKNENAPVPVLTPVLTLDVANKEISVPSSTKTNIDSDTIEIGNTKNSITTVIGTTLNLNTVNTSITGTTNITGSTTINNGGNKVVVSDQGTQVTGKTATINPTTVEIGTGTTTDTIKIGNTNKGTTTLQSNKTEVTSPTLNVNSDTITFSNSSKPQSILFKGNTTSSSSVKSTVPTSIENTTFSVKKVVEGVVEGKTTSTITPVLEVSAPINGDLTTTISGTKATINPTEVNIGTANTSTITIGSTGTTTQDTTTLQSNKTEVTSSTINIGNSGDKTINLGTSSSKVKIEGKNYLLLSANDTESSIKSNNIEFTNSLYSNKIKIYWDDTIKSLVFARAEQSLT